MKHSLNLRFTMSTLQEVEKLIAKMTRAEKAQLLQWMVHDLGDTFPGIDTIAGVCGGEPCIVRTRIPVWVLEPARRLEARAKQGSLDGAQRNPG